jgi:hypothetical protein
MPSGSLCCDETQMCVDYNLGDFCDPGFRCASAEDLIIDESCNISCQECMPLPDLVPGLLATHLDATRIADGSIVLSGYSPGVPSNTPYGDLVVGVSSGEFFDWEIIDGAPEGPVSAGITGWRDGISAPGDDVGRWTSIASSGDTLMISYYDATNSALKLATRAGGMWQVETVDDLGDTGRYSSLALDASGEPAIAYQVIDPATTTPGRPTSRVRVASRSGGVWSSADIHVVEMACRPSLCPAGATCLESGECIMPSADCGECADGEACAAGTCSAALPDGYVEDLMPATGVHNELAATSSGFALAWYDRSAGNVLAARYDGSWSETFLVDGYARMDARVGDCGLGLSLAVDSSDVWHLTYVDGTEEALRYANVDGTTVTTSLVDDGATDGVDPHTDGRHIVGDDSSVGITASGEVRVAYQDATVQRAMLATRSTEGTWTVSTIDSTDHTGFWLVHLVDGERSDVATWWRNQADGMNQNGVRLLTVE